MDDQVEDPLNDQTFASALLLRTPVERLVSFSDKPLSDSVHRQHYGVA
ncbi:MAG: hypothetical protein ACREXV_14090 [Polaromonas sp.]